MISFHPLPKLKTLIKSVFTSTEDPSVTQLFPHNSTHFLDSGTSAFALTIEKLHLENSHMALPAFLCDDLTPVLKHYHITPHFLDIDPKTFVPHPSSYAQIIDEIDAALLVRTYGNPVPHEVYELLSQHNITSIEDQAHCPLPYTQESINADAVIYSLTKTATTPDGGLAVIPKNKDTSFPSQHITLGYIRNVLKLIDPLNTLMYRIRSHTQLSIIRVWDGIHTPHKLSLKLLNEYLHNRQESSWIPQYCYPLYTHDPQKAKKSLQREGISAERIWDKPIVLSYEDSLENYPHTKKAADSVICVPGWHIHSKEEEAAFLNHLQHILSDNLA